MAAEMSRAASQGIDCSAANLLFVCDRIKQLHTEYARFAYVRQKKLELGSTEQQYDVQVVNLRLASLEATLAAEKAGAASQGIDCSTTDTKSERTETATTEPGR